MNNARKEGKKDPVAACWLLWLPLVVDASSCCYRERLDGMGKRELEVQDEKQEGKGDIWNAETTTRKKKKIQYRYLILLSPCQEKGDVVKIHPFILVQYIPNLKKALFLKKKHFEHSW